MLLVDINLLHGWMIPSFWNFITNYFALYACMLSCSVMSDSLRPHGLQPTRLLRPWDFPGKNTEVGYHFLLQDIFLTQGLNLGLLHCRQTLYRLSHQGMYV